MSGVLFLDIVEYSKKSVSGQISLKDRFNSYLSAAIRDVPVSDRIILDTGDGAAINFLGDVEDALKAALCLRESISSEDTHVDPPLQVRVGINLGPVRLVRDINGQPNIVGDGINVAQRVMGFADINQILVSRSYYDAVSRLSPQYAGLFHFQGSRTDKHVREHEVYAVGRPGDKTTELAAANMLAVEEAKTPGHILASVKIAWNSAAAKLDSAIDRLVVLFRQADPKQRAIYIGAIAVPVVLIGALLLKLTTHDKAPAVPDIGQMQAASGIQPVSADTAVAPATRHAENKAEGTAKQQVATVKPGSKMAVDPVKRPTVAPKVAERKPTVNKASVAQTGSSAEKAKNAYLYIVCKAGTQIFVDGTDKGKVSPAGLTVSVAPGAHKIIVTSKSGSLYTQNVELSPGRTVRIKPNFCD
ncbi:MAG: adenylate/guanylate cyclase domain-containing protein [Gallionella sp.]|nr:adenylate/guanylate cyclase domain-containing protein [Gallionella sp.]